MQWLRLTLDLKAFDDRRFRHYLERCRLSGITFTTMAELGDATAHRRSLYELNKILSADIPERGEFYTFDEYVEHRIDTLTYRPAGVVIALAGDTWVGMAATSIHQAKGYAFSEMTGVLAAHRGRGIAIAMKLLAIEFARSAGMGWLRTFHHPANVAAIAMNRRLGFVDDDQVS